jgi:hypothetical protein
MFLKAGPISSFLVKDTQDINFKVERSRFEGPYLDFNFSMAFFPFSFFGFRFTDFW